jgi:hypothetical protein
LGYYVATGPIAVGATRFVHWPSVLDPNYTLRIRIPTTVHAEDAV